MRHAVPEQPPQPVEHYKSRCSFCEGSGFVPVLYIHFLKNLPNGQVLECKARIRSEEDAELIKPAEDESDFSVISGQKPCSCRKSISQQKSTDDLDRAEPGKTGSEASAVSVRSESGPDWKTRQAGDLE